MGMVEDTPAETFAVRLRRGWRPKTASSNQGNAPTKPRGRPFSRDVDWRLVGLIGASVTAGVLVGAGIMLLTAPQSGAHTRLALSRELKRRRPWSTSPWDRLGQKLNKAAGRRNRRLNSAAESHAS